MTNPTANMNAGTKVFVSDPYSEFGGTLLNDETSPLARVRDDETGEVMVGSWDFVEPV